MDLLAVCIAQGVNLNGLLTHEGAPVDGGRLLWAISGIESSHGRDREYVRCEPSYSPGGPYYDRSTELRQLWKRYGVLAGSSFGSFQIMYLTAYELGFRGHPIRLQEDDICGAMAVVLIKERIIKHDQAETLSDVLDAYNSGSHRDRLIPQAYIRHGTALYLEGLPTSGASDGPRTHNGGNP